MDKLLWVDLETSGADYAYSNILEVGAAITDYDFNIIDTFQCLVQPLSLAVLNTMSPVVTEMHKVNGLSDEITRKYNEIPYKSVVDKNLVKWVVDYAGSEQVPLAGSGVLHFDRNFIRRDFPRFDKHLTYWGYDVGVVRRVLRDFVGSKLVEEHHEPAHRALDDVLSHINEMSKYVDWMRKVRDL